MTKRGAAILRVAAGAIVAAMLLLSFGAPGEARASIWGDAAVLAQTAASPAATALNGAAAVIAATPVVEAAAPVNTAAPVTTAAPVSMAAGGSPQPGGSGSGGASAQPTVGPAGGAAAPLFTDRSPAPPAAGPVTSAGPAGASHRSIRHKGPAAHTRPTDAQPPSRAESTGSDVAAGLAGTVVKPSAPSASGGDVGAGTAGQPPAMLPSPGTSGSGAPANPVAGATSTALASPSSLLGALALGALGLPPPDVDLSGLAPAGVDLSGMDPAAPGPPTGDSADPAWPLSAGDIAVLGVSPPAPGTAGPGGGAAGTPTSGPLSLLLQEPLGSGTPAGAPSGVVADAQSDAAGAPPGSHHSGGGALLVPGRRAPRPGRPRVPAGAPLEVPAAGGPDHSFRAILAMPVGVPRRAGHGRERAVRRARPPASAYADDSQPIFNIPLTTTSGAAATAGTGIGLGATAVILLGALSLWTLQFVPGRVSLELAAWRSALLAMRLERPG